MSVNKKVDGRGRVRYEVYVYEVAAAKKISGGLTCNVSGMAYPIVSAASV